MQDALYINRNMALINYTKAYYTSYEELVNSEAFELFIHKFLDDYKYRRKELYNWLVDNRDEDDIVKYLIKITKLLLVFDIEEIGNNQYLDRTLFLQVVEDVYLYWRNMQRYSYIYTLNQEGLQYANFIDADSQFNALILGFYRMMQEKIQGSKNKVYRQLQAGTNASFILTHYLWKVDQAYYKLYEIPFINSILLRTPLIIHPKSNKRLGMFNEVYENPMSDFEAANGEWLCFPCYVGELLTFVYCHRDFASSAVALSNLFEMAKAEDCIDKKPDCIVLFGVKDNKNETTFYHDKVNQIFVGKVSYGDVIEYFGYMKKMCLTLHNLAMQERGYLPIHGAMINLHLKDGTKKGVVLMGDSGAGKSETIEALNNISGDEIIYSEIVFDDMGSMHIEDGVVVAQGSEIGAFVRLDDLDKGSAYKDMDRSIFFNPESANARVVIPAAPYNVVVKKHKVDMFIYANNYTDKRGLHQFTDLKAAKQVFIEGKRFALGTTQEKGESTTFFANPFGPMQRQEQCLPIIDYMFEALKMTNIYIGEIYTCLGLPNKGDNGLEIAAHELLKTIKE